MDLVIPDNYVGFGAIFEGANWTTPLGKYESNNDHLKVWIDKSGGAKLGATFRAIRIHETQLHVAYASGMALPLHLSSTDPTDGVRFWLLPRPASGALYFFVGTLEQVNKFDPVSNGVYADDYRIDGHF